MKKLLSVIAISCFLLLQQGCAARIYKKNGAEIPSLVCIIMPVACMGARDYDLNPSWQKCLRLERIQIEDEIAYLDFEAAEFESSVRALTKMNVREYKTGYSYLVESRVQDGKRNNYVISSIPCR